MPRHQYEINDEGRLRCICGAECPEQSSGNGYEFARRAKIWMGEHELHCSRSKEPVGVSLACGVV